MQLADLVQSLAEHVALTFTPRGPAAEISGIAIVDSPTEVEVDPEILLVVAAHSEERAVATMEAALASTPPAVVVAHHSPELVASWYRRAQERNIALMVLDGSAPVSAVVALMTDILRPVRDAASGADVRTGDLYALADAFADMMDAPTILEDENFRVLAYSSFVGSMDQGRRDAILRRQIPDDWWTYLSGLGAIKRLRASTEVIDLAAGPAQARRRLITSVRLGNRMLGVLWVAEGDTPLPTDAAERMRRMANLAVPHYLDYSRRQQEEQERRGLLVGQLLDGTHAPGTVAAEIGLGTTASVAVCSFVSAAALPVEERTWARLADHVSLSFQMYGWHTAVARSSSAIRAIVDVGTASAPDLNRVGQQICDRSVASSAAGLRGCASQIHVGLGQLRAQREQSDDGLGFLLDEGGDSRPFVGFDDVRPQLLVRRVTGYIATDPTWRLPALEILERTDSERGSKLVWTLATYVDHNGNLSSASRALQIHPTTLRYRMGQIAKLTSLDLGDATVRLALTLSIRAFAHDQRSTGAQPRPIGHPSATSSRSRRSRR